MRRPLLLVVLAALWLCAGSVTAAYAQQDVTGADLEVSKTGPDTASPGGDMVYTITVTNRGPDAANDVTMNDTLPAGTTFVSVDPSASCSTPSPGSAGTVTCTMASLDVDAPVTFTLTVHVDPNAQPGTFFSNTATVSASTPDPNDENNSSTTTAYVPEPATADVGVTKSAPSAALPGGNIEYVLELTNTGPDAAADVHLTDTLPGTLTFVDLAQDAGPTASCTTPSVGSGGTVTCTLDSLPAGSTVRLRLTAHVPADTASGTEFTNTATTTTSTFDNNDENNSATAATTISNVDVAVTKSGPASAVAGTNVSYHITVSNAGPDPADTTLQDALPPETTYVSLTQDSGPAFDTQTPGVGQAGTVTADGSLAAGQSASFTLVVRLDAAIAGGTTVTNRADVTTDQADSDTDNNSASASTSVSAAPVDVSVTKSAPAEATPGATISYTVAASNAGPGPARSFVLSDPLPASTRFVSASQTGGPALALTTPAAGGSGTVTASGTLPAGETVTFVIDVKVDSAAVVGSKITNTASASTSSTDTDSSNDAGSATTTVVAVPVVEPPPGGTTQPPGGDNTQPPGGGTTQPGTTPTTPVPVKPRILGLRRSDDDLVVRFDPGDVSGPALVSIRTAGKKHLGRTLDYVDMAEAQRVVLDPATGKRSIEAPLTKAGEALLAAHHAVKVVVRITPDDGPRVRRTFRLRGRLR